MVMVRGAPASKFGPEGCTIFMQCLFDTTVPGLHHLIEHMQHAFHRDLDKEFGCKS